MTIRRLTALALGFVALGAMGSPWLGDSADAASRYKRSTYYRTTDVVPVGTSLSVRLDDKISTEHANRGDGWSGTITHAVSSDGRVVIPAGSRVQGVVTSVRQGTHSTRPLLGLAVRKVTIDGRTYAVDADAEPIVAGTKRSKKIGVVVGGTAAGALLGGVVGGKKGAVIGGLLGGAGTYYGTRGAFRTMQLKPGTELTFTTREALVATR